jgi:hypothetical protein
MRTGALSTAEIANATTSLLALDLEQGWQADAGRTAPILRQLIRIARPQARPCRRWCTSTREPENPRTTHHHDGHGRRRPPRDHQFVLSALHATIRFISGPFDCEIRNEKTFLD